MKPRNHAPHKAHPAAQPDPIPTPIRRERTEKEMELIDLQEETRLAYERMLLFHDAVLLYLNETDDSPRAEQLGEHIVRGMQDLGGCINAERKFHAEGEEVALL